MNITVKSPAFVLDYDPLLNEAGDTTDKYFEAQRIINASYYGPDIPNPDVPENSKKATYDVIFTKYRHLLRDILLSDVEVIYIQII